MSDQKMTVGNAFKSVKKSVEFGKGCSSKLVMASVPALEALLAATQPSTQIDEAAERLRFESIAESDFPLHRRNMPLSDRLGQYCEANVEDCWQFWLAARRSAPGVDVSALQARIAKLEAQLVARGLGLGGMVDLKHSAYDRLCSAAAKSPWVPPEYFANDWLADLETFLLENRSAPSVDVSDSKHKESAITDILTTLGLVDNVLALRGYYKDSTARHNLSIAVSMVKELFPAMLAAAPEHK